MNYAKAAETEPIMYMGDRLVIQFTKCNNIYCGSSMAISRSKSLGYDTRGNTIPSCRCVGLMCVSICCFQA